MHIEVVRQGGIAGVTLHGAIDTQDLPQDLAREVSTAVQNLPFGRLPSSPQHPDSFQYQITITEGGTPRSITLDEAQVPSGLRPALDAAVARGHLD
jgi:hypothetical protein